MPLTKHMQSMSIGLTTDGRAYLLQITTMDGETHNFIANMETLMKMISGLLRSSQEAVTKLPAIESRLQTSQEGGPPIEAKSAQFTRPSTTKETVLSVDTGSGLLSFALPRDELQKLKQSLDATLAHSDSSRLH